MARIHRWRTFCLIGTALCIGTFFLSRPRAVSADVDTAKQLQALLDSEWQYELQRSPETATALGDKRYNAELTDFSPEAFRKDAQRKQEFLSEFEKIDAHVLDPEDVLNRSLIIRKLKVDIESIAQKDWEMPVDQMNGVHLGLAQLPGITRFETVHDYDDYISRLHKYPRTFQQIEEDLNLGIHDRLMPPKYLLQKCAAQAKQIAETPLDSSPFAKSIEKFPSQIGAADQARLRTAVQGAIQNDVAPAYAQFADFLAKRYAPKGRLQPGVWSVPNGDERYRIAVRVMTTTDLTPEQFHEIGLQQVSAIEKEMLEVAHAQHFTDLASFNAHIKNTKSFYAKSSQQIYDLYSGYIDQMRPEMPKLFGRQPKAQLEVVPMEAFRTKSAPAADYMPGAADGSRAGRVNVNGSDPTHRLTTNIEAIAYHEGIPGHHQQIALAQELTGLPDFRKNAGYTAFVEGWALYSESLGKEVGFYKDPYSDYGRLENDMWRAVRLVVDTGVHYKHWSRQQMVDFFHEHTAMDEPNVQSEVDRYIAWPGQALAYKAGQLKILALRKRAQQGLGDKFDLKAFHDAVLSEGALPLDVLETRIDAWIASQQKT